MQGVEYEKLTEPTQAIAAAITRWENDPELVPFTRRCATREEAAEVRVVTCETLRERIRTHETYLVSLEGQLVGEVNYQVDPPVCLRAVPGSAWLGISIGEAGARNRGVGSDAMRHIEAIIRCRGLARIELGVFEFNERARHVYRKLGYEEFGRIADFTWWKGRMWQDIRMEKRL